MLKSKVKGSLLLLFISFSFDVLAFGDPTKPPGTIRSHQKVDGQDTKKTEVLLKLNAVKIQGNLKIAVINGVQYNIGQAVGSSTVKSISSNEVVLASGKTLSLFDKTHATIANKDY